MRSDDAYLLDMLVAAREAREFASCMTFAEFGRNRMAQLAVLKSVEVVGEAASRLSSEGIKMHREIPWKKIIGMRNRLVHGYFDINLKRIWETVQNDIPVLISRLEPHVPPEAEEP